MHNTHQNYKNYTHISISQSLVILEIVYPLHFLIYTIFSL